MDKINEARIAELTGKTIDDAVAAFGELSDAELKALHDLEGEMAKRKGLLSAIHAELAAREYAAKEVQIRALAEEAGVKVYFESDLRERVEAIEAKLAEAEGAAPALGLPAQPRKLAITGQAEEPFLRVAFTGDDDVTVEGLPELEFTRGSFRFDHSRQMVSLEQPIVFPEAVRRAEICKAWLLDGDGEAASMVRFVSPLAVGGGTRAKIPAGNLGFPHHKARVETEEDA